jgi:hypothetical protein
MATAAGPVAGSIRRFQIANGGEPPTALDDSDEQGLLLYDHLVDTFNHLSAGDRAAMDHAIDVVPAWRADPWTIEAHIFEEAALQLLGVWPRVDPLAQALIAAYPRPLNFAECVPILSG